MKRAAAFAVALLAAGCTKSELLDFAMQTAPRPAPAAAPALAGHLVLAGDLHTHVLPPDSGWHVSRGYEETLAIARAEGLDFVVLTPHVPARFFARPDKRAWVRETQAALRATVAAHPPGDLVVVVGMEYTDHRYGHVGLGFASIEDVLDEVPVEEARRRPEAFFERWTAHGGVMTINHPVLRGIPHAPFRELTYDLGWRALFAHPPPVPPEIAFITEHAQTIETFNTSVSHLRDRYIVGDPDWTLRGGAHLADRVARTQHRRITPVGGSDSHSRWLRPTTWVLARSRNAEGIRDALVAGRTCVRGPQACSLSVRATGGPWATVGASLASPPSRTLDVTSSGGPATYYVNGAVAARAADGETASIAVPGTCALVRAVVGESWSSPIYVDCAFAR